MSKILKFEDYLMGDLFKEQVTKPLTKKIQIYELIRNAETAIAFRHYHLYVYVFLSYIPNNIETELPTVENSFNNIAQKNIQRQMGCK